MDLPYTMAGREQAGNYDVEVLVTDAHGERVFRAVISMWVSPKKTAG